MAIIDTLAGVAIGAWAGYITNDIALRMIFRAYGIGRFKFGGVIPRTRASFIESLASLAEDELLQGDALRGSIDSDAFRDAVARLFYVAAGRALDGGGRAGQAAGPQVLAAVVQAQAATPQVLAAALQEQAAAPRVLAAGPQVLAATPQVQAAARGRIAHQQEQITPALDAAAEQAARALGRLARVLLRTAPDAIGDEAVALAQRFIGASRPEIASLLDGMASGLREDAALAAAWDAFAAENRHLPVKHFIGERYFGEISANFAQAARLAGSLLENELCREASSAIENAASLIFDVRATDRFFAAIDSETLGSVLRLDIQGLAAYLARCAEAAAARGKGQAEGEGRAEGGGEGQAEEGGRAGGGSEGQAEGEGRAEGGGREALWELADALSESAALEGLALGGVASGDGRAAARALVGACDAASEAVAGFFTTHADEIGRMAERSLAKAAESEGVRRGGVLGFARRALIQDAGGRYRVVQRLSAFTASRISSLKTAEGAQAAIDALLAVQIADMLRALSRRTPAGTGNGQAEDPDAWVVGMVPGILHAMADMRPASLYSGITDSQKADTCLYIAQAVGKAAQAAVLKPGAAQSALAGIAAESWDAFGGAAAIGHLASAAGRLAEPGAASRLVGKLLDDDGGLVRSEPINGERRGVRALAAGMLRRRADSGRPVVGVKALRATLDRAIGWARAAMGGGAQGDSGSARVKAAFEKLSRPTAKLLARHLGILIQGNAKAAIKKRLGSFNDEALQRLAQQFFGSLKHIVAIGAILGAVAGLASSALESASAAAVSAVAGMNSAGSASAVPAATVAAMVLSVVARIALFAAIGWGTNIVAVEMLFRPKRAVRLFGFRISSVINMNKGKLADAVGRFVDDSLLDPEAARHVARLGETQFRETVVVATEERAEGLARSALENNGARIAGWIDEKARSLLSGHADEAAGSAISWLSGALESAEAAPAPVPPPVPREASQETPREVPREASQETPREVPREAQARAPQGGSLFVAAIGALRGSNADALGALFGSPRETGEAVEAAARSALRELDAVELRGLLRRLVRGPYESWLKRRASDALLPPSASVAAALASLAESGVFHSALRRAIVKQSKAWRRTLPAALADALERGRGRSREDARGSASGSVGSGASGGAKEGASGGEAFWFGWLCGKAAEYDGSIADALKGAIGRNLGFLPGVAWRVVDGDAIIRAAIPIFIREEVPEFLRKHMDEADGVLRGAAASALRAAGAVGVFKLDGSALADAASKALGDPACRDATSGIAAESICRALADAKVGPALNALGAGSPHELLARCDPAIRVASEAIAENIRIEADEVAREVGSLTESLAAALGGQLTFARLLDEGAVGGAAEEFASSLAELAGELGLVAAAARATKGALAENRDALAYAAAGWLRGEAQGDFRGLLETCISCAAANLGEIAGKVSGEAVGETVGEAARQGGSPSDSIGSVNDVPGGAPNLWRAVAELAAGAGFDALTDEMPTLVGALDLKRVARQQVDAMDEDKIERMFKSFAGRYLRRIKLYGLWGGLFGTHAAVPVATALAAAFASIKNALSRRRHAKRIDLTH